MQFVRTEMCVTPRHRQTLVPEQVCYVFERRSFHSQPARKSGTQVIPVKVSELRFCYRIFEPMTAIFEGLARFHRRKDSSITIPDFKYRRERTNSRIVQRDVQRLL